MELVDADTILAALSEKIDNLNGEVEDLEAAKNYLAGRNAELQRHSEIYRKMSISRGELLEEAEASLEMAEIEASIQREVAEGNDNRALLYASERDRAREGCKRLNQERQELHDALTSTTQRLEEAESHIEWLGTKLDEVTYQRFPAPPRVEFNTYVFDEIDVRTRTHDLHVRLTPFHYYHQFATYHEPKLTKGAADRIAHEFSQKAMEDAEAAIRTAIAGYVMEDPSH